MKTDSLIEMLATNVEPVQPGTIARAFAWALAIGAVAAFCAMLAMLGIRGEVAMHSSYLAVKLAFALSLVALGTAFLVKAVHPGRKGRLVLISLPFIVAGGAALVALWLHPGSWYGMAFGEHWATCLYCIPLFAVVPFAVLVWALRKGAPMNLPLTGAVAGLVAGALGAAAYAFYCPDDYLPFVAIWYGAAIAACALVGAILGPRLLRW